MCNEAGLETICLFWGPCVMCEKDVKRDWIWFGGFGDQCLGRGVLELVFVWWCVPFGVECEAWWLDPWYRALCQ